MRDTASLINDRCVGMTKPTEVFKKGMRVTYGTHREICVVTESFNRGVVARSTVDGRVILFSADAAVRDLTPNPDP